MFKKLLTSTLDAVKESIQTEIQKSVPSQLENKSITFFADSNMTAELEVISLETTHFFAKAQLSSSVIAKLGSAASKKSVAFTIKSDRHNLFRSEVPLDASLKETAKSEGFVVVEVNFMSDPSGLTGLLTDATISSKAVKLHASLEAVRHKPVSSGIISLDVCNAEGLLDKIVASNGDYSFEHRDVFKDDEQKAVVIRKLESTNGIKVHQFAWTVRGDEKIEDRKMYLQYIAQITYEKDGSCWESSVEYWMVKPANAKSNYTYYQHTLRTGNALLIPCSNIQ